jgi:hypothetical protein
VLDSQWSTWFEGLAITTDMPGQTLIAGPVTDQAALHGLLAKIRDLGLPLLSVRYLGPDQQPTGGSDARTFICTASASNPEATAAADNHTEAQTPTGQPARRTPSGHLLPW